MSNPIQDLLNQMIKNQLPAINKAIQKAIISKHLDPWGQVSHGSDYLGSINFEIFKLSSTANYNIGHMKGLSAFTIDALEIQSVVADPNDASKLGGHLYMTASLKKSITAHIGGSIRGTFHNFIHNISQSVGIGGTATVSNITTEASGSFMASSSGGSICLNHVDLNGLSVDYGSLHVGIDGLGIFRSLLYPLTDAIIGLFKGPIKGAISSAVTPEINKQITALLPQCKNL